MYWYEHGRRRAGKMPPSDKIINWIKRHGIRPDPERRCVLSLLLSIGIERRLSGLSTMRLIAMVPIDVLVAMGKNKGIVPTEEFALKSLAFAIGKEIVNVYRGKTCI